MPSPRPQPDPDPSSPDPGLSAPPPEQGWIAPDVAEEHPGLELLTWSSTTTWTSRSRPWAREWLARLSTRIDGPAVLNAFRDDAPAAHRVFWGRIGRDATKDRAPQEAAFYDRIAHGGFPVRDPLQDLLLVVLLETGVPIWALDGDRVSGDLGIRRSLTGELVGPGDAPPTRPEPVVVDREGVVAEIGREPREPFRATHRSARTTFFCARVPGLPDLRVHEAVWLCRSLEGRSD